MTVSGIDSNLFMVFRINTEHGSILFWYSMNWIMGKVIKLKDYAEKKRRKQQVEEDRKYLELVLSGTKSFWYDQEANRTRGERTVC